MSRDEVAAFLGISSESVRTTLARYDIHEQRGYPRDQVEQLERPGKGWRAGQRGSHPADPDEQAPDHADEAH